MHFCTVQVPSAVIEVLRVDKNGNALVWVFYNHTLSVRNTAECCLLTHFFVACVALVCFAVLHTTAFKNDPATSISTMKCTQSINIRNNTTLKINKIIQNVLLTQSVIDCILEPVQNLAINTITTSKHSDFSIKISQFLLRNEIDYEQDLRKCVNIQNVEPHKTTHQYTGYKKYPFRAILVCTRILLL